MTGQADTSLLRWSFSTLGCADLSFPEICGLASAFHLPGIELRGVAGRLDLPQYCEEHGWSERRLSDLCGSHNTRLIVAGSSVKLADAEATDREELMRFSQWADDLGIPYVRVFGGGVWGKPLTETRYFHAADLVNWWRRERLARHWKVELLLETHDAFSCSDACLRLNERLAEPLSIIWDSHHTWKLGGESPAQTWSLMGSLIRHVHVKDSIDQPSARHPYTYVLPGKGRMPMGEVVDILCRNRFAGYVSLEWERFWHPYLPPIQEALKHLQKQPWFEARPNVPHIPVLAH